jgi:hypothetical protein
MPNIPYKVDEDPQKTDTPQMTVRQILVKAGRQPADQYYLVRKQPKEDEKLADLDQTITVHAGDHFHAVFTGPMTTS